MTQSEALALLSDGFAQVSPDVAREICTTLSIPFDENVDAEYRLTQCHLGKPGTPDTPVDLLFLSDYVCKQLGVSPIGQLYAQWAPHAKANSEAIGAFLAKKGDTPDRA